MVLTRGGAEGAHRSWAFSFIGIAVRVRPGLVFRAASCGCRAFGAARPLRRAFRPARCQGRCRGRRAHRHGCRERGVGCQRLLPLPGSAHVGDDARSVSREGAAVAAWMAAHAPVDTPVLADRYVSQQVGSVGRMVRVAAQRRRSRSGTST